MATYLTASDEAASSVWHSIPKHAVCPLCLGHVPEERIGKGRVWCGSCDAYVWPKVLRGLVSADLAKMAGGLRAGKIPVRRERGER
jgi:hypothetical protein